MKKIITTLSILSIILFSSCEKESYLPDEHLSTILEESFINSNSFNSEPINKALKLGKDNFQVKWSDYEIIKFNKKANKTTYEFDAYLKNNITNNSKLFANEIIYKLIMTTDEKDIQEYKVLRFEPFKDSKNLTPSFQNMTSYDGMKFVLNIDGKIDDIITYKDGNQIASFKTSVLDKQNDGTTLKKEAVFCDPTSFFFDAVECNGGLGNGGSGGGYVLETTTNETDWYTLDSDGEYLHTNGLRYTYNSTYTNSITTRWVWVSSGNDYTYRNYTSMGHSPGGSNSFPSYHGPRKSSWTGQTILFTNISDPIITNVTKYFECFDLSLGGIITIYVDQPNANTSETWALSVTGPDVGHTFISLTQNGITRTFGYYPTASTINPIGGVISSVAVIRNNQGHEFDVSISTSISASQLSTIINSSINYNTTYNLNSYNCTDFGITIANSVGMNLTDTSGTWPGNGSGSNPGNLGQDIRSMTLPAGTTLNNSGGNAPNNNGTCN